MTLLHTMLMREPRVLAGVVLSMVACTDAALQPKEADPLETVDNRLSIHGEYCSQPDTEVTFPVKVLFVVDQSTSLQCTDSRNRRFEALNGLIDDLRRSRATQVGFIGFANWTRIQGFTRDRSAFGPFVDPTQGLGPATDYQGALATTLSLIEDDILAIEPAERARTRYVVVLVSDGVPQPRCLAGCEDDITNCSDGRDNDGDGLADGSDPDCDNINDASLHPDILSGVCNTDMEIPDDVYVDFDGVCPAYNQDSQIMQRVRDVLALEDIYSVGGISINSVFLFSPQAVVESVCPGAAQNFGIEQDQARTLLQAIAKEGNGTFRDANLATNNDNFLQFDFRSLQAQRSLTSLVATNAHARLFDGEYAPDTDHDGLPDAREDELGTDPRHPDSDEEGGDGYSDLFEAKLVDQGFDPLDRTVPARPCTQTSDLDGDRLRDCEESFLGTDLRHPDTDNDGLPDFEEFVAGTDPLEDDVRGDLDFDGLLNEDEVLGGSDPLVPNTDQDGRERVQYGLTELGRREVQSFETNAFEERQCYAFEVNDLRLVVTPIVPDRGLNRIVLQAMEAPGMLAGAKSSSFVACFEAFLYGETAKSPPDGLIDVTNAGWNEILSRVQGEIDSLAACPGFPEIVTDRAPVEQAVRDCLPEGIPLAGFEVTRAEAVALVQKYVAPNGAVNMPQPASELFVPIERFNPDQHCYRPWELDRLSELFVMLAEACDPCDPDAMVDAEP
ncbi:MAG: VWA domain-containing protein [Myxococcales bacterium]|nr:VWA domain-containing protein [Myxococcales bacterium]MDD9968381.1 VWA domain-containing protein [Myxococcales bacterium]